MKTVFVALDFHLKNTKSSQFFIDILQENIPNLSIVSVSNAWYDIPRIKPDTIIIWQHIFTPQEIDCWKAKNVIIIPMYDACPHTEEFWNKYKKYKVFCFSKTLFSFLKERNFDTYHSQYYIKPEIKSIEESQKLSFFFWERSKKIHWNLVKDLLGNIDIDTFHYHYSTKIREKNLEEPTTTDIAKYNIEFSDWFSTNEEYINLLEKTSVYIAPRESEGIGLSFIEALAKGCLVVAYNAPTMNEYVVHGETGYLFSEETQKAFDFSKEKIAMLRKNSLQKAQTGWALWEKSKPEIVNFIQKSMTAYKPQASFFVLLKKRIKAEIRFLIKGR